MKVTFSVPKLEDFMTIKPLDELIDEIIKNDKGENKDRYTMKPSPSDVAEWLNSAGGIDTNFDG